MTKRSTEFYRENLAYIHDAGFGGVAEHAAARLQKDLSQAGVETGLVVDLGCGSGKLSAAMARAGYDVLGIDFSDAMVELARRRAPKGEFQTASILDVDPPSCVAATLVGEVVNYLFDARNTDARLVKLFQRIYRALEPDGLLLLDAAGPGRVPGGKRRSFTEGEGWVCLVDVDEDKAKQTLTRRIITFRQSAGHWRRDDEVHRQRLYRPADLAALLRRAGFRVSKLRGYQTPFPPGVAGFLAHKPAR